MFLDIRMPSGSEGFEFLEEVENKNFQVVFVTAFKDYAIRAFNASAVYYLLKPIDIDELQEAVNRLIKRKKELELSDENYETYFQAIKALSETMLKGKPSSKVAISHSKGLKIVDEDEILRLEASGNCTMIYFTDGKRYLDTRTLKVYEELLNPDKFYRVHKSHIINIDKLKEYIHEDGHYAIIEGGTLVPVARNRVSEFVKSLKKL